MDAIRFTPQTTSARPATSPQPAREPKALTATGVAALRAYGQPTQLRLQREGDVAELSQDASTPRIVPKGDASAMRTLAAAKVPVTDELVQTVGGQGQAPAPITPQTPTRSTSGAIAMYRTAAQFNAAATGVAMGSRLDAQA